MTSITLFAEYLLHIRTLSLYISLATSHTRETKALLSADREHVTVTHEGASATIRLPTRIGGGGEAALTLPDVRERGAGSKELTLRLALEENPGEAGRFLRVSGNGENVVPWSAVALRDASAIACRDCGNRILCGGLADASSSGHVLRGWNDLPSENWAEMMDFWHCHKPDPEEGVGNAGSTKGYAAANKVRALQGEGLVGLGHMLLHEQDCRGITIVGHGRNRRLVCESCGNGLGLVDDIAEGFKVFKWAISVPSAGRAAQFFSVQKWVAATVLHEVETTGARKYIVREEGADGARDSLLIWIFTPDLYFSSSVPSGNRSDPTRAMRVLWKPLEADAASRPEFKSTEELELPASLYQALDKALTDSGGILPQSARNSTPAGWNLGMLQRFDRNDISS